jgi:hypothetical protein
LFPFHQFFFPLLYSSDRSPSQLDLHRHRPYSNKSLS